MTYQAALQKIEQAAKWLRGRLARITSRSLLFSLLLIFCAFLPSCFGTVGEPTIPAKKVSEIVVPLPNLQLDFFDQPDRQEILARHLANSAAWNVTSWSESKHQSTDGVWHRSVDLSASRRNWETGCGWQPADSTKSFIQFRLSPTAMDLKNPVQVIENGAKTIKIESYTNSHSNDQEANYTTLNSVIRITSKSRKLLLDINEQSDNRDRTFTTNFLENISHEFTQLSKSSTASQSGFDPKQLAPGSMINSQKPVFKIGYQRDGHGFACSATNNDKTVISGYVNPREAGYVYVMAEFETNRGIDGAKSEETEYVGWSNNSAEQFFFDIRVYLRSFDLGSRPVKFQLWFHPLMGGADRLLLTKTEEAMVNSGMWGEFFKGKKK
jgi:hypothetical protein